MKKKITTQVLFFILLSSIALAQIPEPTDFEQKLSYTEFETDYYLVNEKDIENLSMLDKVKMKELKSEKEFTKYINSNDERTTIVKHVSSENTYRDWMDKPEILLIDKNGVSQLTYSGEIVSFIEHTPKYLEMSKNLGGDILPVFTIPTREQKLIMKDNGLEIIDLDEGFTLIKSQNGEMIYNEELLYLEENQLNEDGEIIRSRKVNFMQLPDGELVYQRIRESQSIELENEIIAEHVFLRLFSNYRYENIYSKNEDVKNDHKIALSLNSDQSSAIVNYEPFTQSETLNFTLYSMSGRIIQSFKSDNNGRNTMDTSDLPPGIYILLLESNGKTISEKFIKL